MKKMPDMNMNVGEISMSEEQSLIKKKDAHSLATSKELSKIFYESGLFSDTKDESQAIVKILAGQEVGLQPIEAMTSIHIIKGKVSMGANMMASAVKRHPDYDYHVKEHTNTKCVIEFFHISQSIGLSEFTIEDAKRAGVSFDKHSAWSKYARNMLFARALSNGVKWYCPDVFGYQPVYVPEEMGANVDEDGDVVDVEFTPSQIAGLTAEIIKKTSDAIGTDEETRQPKTQSKPTVNIDYPREKINADMRPRDVFDIILDHVMMTGDGLKVARLFEQEIEGFSVEGWHPYQYPESAIISVLRKITGIEFEAAEEVFECKCGAAMAEPEVSKQSGLCRICWTEKGDK